MSNQSETSVHEEVRDIDEICKSFFKYPLKIIIRYSVVDSD
jgi:hypothetical protein